MNSIPETKIKPSIALITGATGFVGGHLAKRLHREGWEVHAVIQQNTHFPNKVEFSNVHSHEHDGSYESMNLIIKNSRPRIVFHLASLFISDHKSSDIQNLVDSNITLGNHLLEAMMENGVECFVNTGTSWQHYDNEVYNPVCLYAATKQAFEAIIDYYSNAYGTRVITLSLFDTYGPNDNRPKLFNLLYQAAARGETIDMSSGEQYIDMVYIDDVIESYILAATEVAGNQKSTHKRYAVSSGNPIRLRDLVEIYAQVADRAIRVNWGARPYRSREVMKTWDQGKPISNWTPKIGLKLGIAETVRSIAQRADLRT